MAKNSDDDRDHEIGRKAAEIEAAARKAQRYRQNGFLAALSFSKLSFSPPTRHHREVGFFAATQVGKTETAAYWVACNLPVCIQSGGRLSV